MFCSGLGHGTPSYPCNRWPRRGSWSPWQRLLQVRCCPATGAQKSGQNQWPTFVNQLSHLILSDDFTFIFVFMHAYNYRVYCDTYMRARVHVHVYDRVEMCIMNVYNVLKCVSSPKRSRRGISIVLLCKSFFVNISYLIVFKLTALSLPSIILKNVQLFI